MNTNFEKYWVGPFGILVLTSIGAVPCADNVNILYRDGSQTKMLSSGPDMEESVYKYLYADYFKTTGKWHYKMNREKENNTILDKGEITFINSVCENNTVSGNGKIISVNAITTGNKVSGNGKITTQSDMSDDDIDALLNRRRRRN